MLNKVEGDLPLNTDLVTTSELFELLSKATRDAVWHWDLDANTIWWNEGYTHLFGYSLEGEDADGFDSWSKHVHPDDEERIVSGIQQVIDQGGSNWSDEYRFRRADGSYATVLDRGYILRRDGKAIRMVGSMQDITEQVTLQKARAESEERLRFALESAQLGTWELDPQSGVVKWDHRCQELCGIIDEHAVQYGRTLEFIHPDDRDRVEKAVGWALNPASGGSYDMSFRTIGESDRKLRWVRFIGQTHFTDTGQAYRFSGVAEDITEEVLAKEKAALSEQQARIALEGSGSGSFMINLLTSEISYSPTFGRILLGDDSENIRWSVFIKHIHPDDKPIRDKAHQVALQTGTINYEARFIWIDKSIHWVKIIGQYQFDANRKPVGVTGIVLDVTEQTEKARALREAEERFSIAFNNTSTGIAFVDTQANFTLVNEAYSKLLGYSAEEFGTLNSFELTHPDDRTWNRQLFEEVVQGKRPYFNLIKRYFHKDSSIRWVQLNVTRVADAQDETQSIILIAHDINERIESEAKLRASEERIRNIIRHAPVAIGILNGRTMVVETANKSMLEIWGKDDSIIGLPLIKALPELDGQGFIELLEVVYDTGAAQYGTETQARLHRKGKLEEAYFNFVYAPIHNSAAEISGIMVVATEVTDQVKAKIALQESEQRFRNLIAQAPVAISLFVGSDMIIDMPNEAMLKFWGKGNVAGLPLAEALPELKGQPFLEILDTVYKTGVEYSAHEAKADLLVDGKLGTYYFNFTYKPIRNAAGEIYAVMDMAIDVTEQVEARRIIEANELRFRTLLEAISQMTWTNTPEGEFTFYNQRWYNYTGLNFDQSQNQGWEAAVHPDDWALTQKTFQQALATGTIFAVENRYRRGSDGMYRWHLNRALPIRDESGNLLLWVGTATDIHEQKQLAASLEEQIQARTEQLMASNYDLRRSNENLEKFAYIASHDLQEPLRKIQSFGDILKAQHAEGLGDGVDYLERMQTAAARMSLLIKDLLTFSRISTRQEMTAVVSLNRVVAEVIDTLEFAIEQSEAKVQVAALPTVSGDESQLRQLFQNLLSNSLKFQKEGTIPLIQIQTERVKAHELPTAVRPGRSVDAYHRISVSDNGIGFDEKYIDRIFQVFQRLHGRNEFAGTGIGLAICEKVVANHGGAITANSKPGQGATFIVYLPIIPTVHH
ncbi:PAS domain S-box protein [Spirosoma gilvum]